MLRHHWNNQKYGASKHRFPHEKEFFRKLSTILACNLKNCATPDLGRKSLKNISFKELQIISMPWASTRLRQALAILLLPLSVHHGIL